MKKVFAVFFCGALFATLAFGDNAANDRFRMKNGRDLPAVERARNFAAVVAAEKLGFTAPAMAANPARNDAEERYFLKNGRLTPQEEARLEKLGAGPASFSSASPAHNDAQERVHMKTGRDL